MTAGECGGHVRARGRRRRRQRGGVQGGFGLLGNDVINSRLQANAAGTSVSEAGAGGGSVAAYKAAGAATIDEYFVSGEVGEVVRRLVELDEPALANMFVKQVNSEVRAEMHGFRFLAGSL